MAGSANAPIVYSAKARNVSPLDWNAAWAFIQSVAGTDATLAGSLIVLDNEKIFFGTGSDASFYYDGTNLIINPKEVGSGYLSILGKVNATAYNISDKKIVCDTFTSDGINACIDSLGAEGGEVYLPEGEYTINSVITIDQNNTVIRGAGFGTYLNATAHTGNVFLVAGKSNCQITDLYVKGSAGSGNSQDLITDNGTLSANFVCRNVKLEDADNYGISWTASGGSYGYFDNVICDDADSNGLYIYGGDNNKIINCTVINNGGNGITVYRNGNTILACYISTNANHGIYGSIGTVIQGCSVLSNSYIGINCNGSGCQIENNLVSFNSRQNIYVIGNTQTVIGNYCYAAGNGYIDIQVGGCDRSIVQGNTIYSYAGRSEWGIYLDGSNDYCIVSGNISYGHDTGGIYLHANTNNTHVIHNNLEGESNTKISDNGTNNTIINSTAGNTSWLKDNSKIMFGAGSDSSIYYDGTNMNIKTDEVAASDLKLTTGAAKTLVLEAPVYKDINISGAILKLAATNNPGLDEFVNESGVDTGITTYAFAPGELVSGSFELQHDYKEGTDLVFHIHWQGIEAPADSTDNVKWTVTYTVAREGETLDATAPVSGETAITTQYSFYRTDCTTITGTNFKIGDQFLFQLKRDTASSDEYGGDALIATAGIHYQCDTIGSRAIGTK